MEGTQDEAKRGLTIIEDGEAKNRLLVQIAFTDQSDLDWMRERIEGAVVTSLDENQARFDGRYDYEVREDLGTEVRPLTHA